MGGSHCARRSDLWRCGRYKSSGGACSSKTRENIENRGRRNQHAKRESSWAPIYMYTLVSKSTGKFIWTTSHDTLFSLKNSDHVVNLWRSVEAKVFSRVYLFVHKGSRFPSDHYPWPHHAGPLRTCSNLFNLDLTVQGPPPPRMYDVRLPSTQLASYLNAFLLLIISVSFPVAAL